MKINCEYILGCFCWFVFLVILFFKLNILVLVFWFGLFLFCCFFLRLLEFDWFVFIFWFGIFGLGVMKGRLIGGLGRIGGGYEFDIIKFWELFDLFGYFWMSLV